MKKTFIIFNFVFAILFVIFHIYRNDLTIFIKTYLPLGAALIAGIFVIFLYIVATIFIISSFIYGFRKRKWQAFSPIILWSLAIVLVLVLPKDTGVEKITVAQATSIGEPYFQKNYGKDITIEEVNYKEIRRYVWRNSITVSDGEEEYVLYLDQNNQPAFDNVQAVEVCKNADISSIQERAEAAGLEISKNVENNDNGFYMNDSYKDKNCSVCFCTTSVDRPNPNEENEVYALLNLLKKEGIQQLSIDVPSPDFLLPKKEFGHGIYGVGIEKETFTTDMDYNTFQAQYSAFADSIYWDEQKFTDKITELEEIGYENPYFFISKWRDENTLEVVLYCESDNNLSDTQAAALLTDIDDSYIKIGDTNIVYVLDHQVN